MTVYIFNTRKFLSAVDVPNPAPRDDNDAVPPSTERGRRPHLSPPAGWLFRDGDARFRLRAVTQRYHCYKAPVVRATDPCVREHHTCGATRPLSATLTRRWTAPRSASMRGVRCEGGARGYGREGGGYAIRAHTVLDKHEICSDSPG